MTTNIAIVGTGGIAEIHASALESLPGARLVAAVDTDETRLRDFAERWAVPRTHLQLSDLLAPGDIDLVQLCTPPAAHAAPALECLRHNVSVLCEKPPARSLAEFDAIAAAQTSEAFFATVFQHRFGGRARRLRELVTAGTLGQAMSAVCHTLWFRPDDYFAVPWRGRWDTEGGGPTMGHGIHQLDLLLSILGPWSEVTAIAARRARAVATEDISAALVTFENGAIATIINSVLAPRETSYLRFDFAAATVEVEHLYGYGDDDWRLTTLPDHSGPHDAWKIGLPGVNSGHDAQLAEVLRAMRTGAAPPVTTGEARVTLELVTAIYAAAFTKTTVKRGQIQSDSPFYHRMDGTGAPWRDQKG